MASITYYVVLSFIRDEDGELVADEGMEAPNGHVATSRARAMIGRKAGAIAFARTGDLALGEFEDDTIVGRYGETPADLMAFTGSGA